MKKNKYISNLYIKLILNLLVSIFFSCFQVLADGEFSYFEFNEIPSLKYINPIYLNSAKVSEQSSNISKNEIKFSLLEDLDFPSPSEYQLKKNLDKKVNQLSEEIPLDKKQSLYNSSGNLLIQDIDVEGKEISLIKIKGLKSIDENLILDNITVSEGDFFNTEILQNDLQKIYSLGYFTDNMSIEPILNSDDTIELYFILEENILNRNIMLVGNNVITKEELLPFVVYMQNKPQNLVEINKSIENIQNYYHEKGYILANVHSVDDDVNGNLSFNIWEGVINKIDISGNERTKDYVIARNIMTQPGTVYNEEYLKKDLAKIFSTQIFEEVDRKVSLNQENEGTYDITVVVREKVTNSIGFGGGIDTGLGAFNKLK